MDPKTFNKSSSMIFNNFDNKMISIGIHKENVIVGDNKGNVYSYQISSKKNSLSFVNKISIQKGKIEQILIFPDDNVNIALNDENENLKNELSASNFSNNEEKKIEIL